MINSIIFIALILINFSISARTVEVEKKLNIVNFQFKKERLTVPTNDLRVADDNRVNIYTADSHLDKIILYYEPKLQTKQCATTFTGKIYYESKGSVHFRTVLFKTQVSGLSGDNFVFNQPPKSSFSVSKKQFETVEFNAPNNIVIESKLFKKNINIKNIGDIPASYRIKSNHESEIEFNGLDLIQHQIKINGEVIYDEGSYKFVFDVSQFAINRTPNGYLVLDNPFITCLGTSFYGTGIFRAIYSKSRLLEKHIVDNISLNNLRYSVPKLPQEYFEITDYLLFKNSDHYKKLKEKFKFSDLYKKTKERELLLLDNNIGRIFIGNRAEKDYYLLIVPEKGNVKKAFKLTNCIQNDCKSNNLDYFKFYKLDKLNLGNAYIEFDRSLFATGYKVLLGSFKELRNESDTNIKNSDIVSSVIQRSQLNNSVSKFIFEIEPNKQPIVIAYEHNKQFNSIIRIDNQVVNEIYYDDIYGYIKYYPNGSSSRYMVSIENNDVQAIELMYLSSIDRILSDAFTYTVNGEIKKIKPKCNANLQCSYELTDNIISLTLPDEKYISSLNNSSSTVNIKKDRKGFTKKISIILLTILIIFVLLYRKRLNKYIIDFNISIVYLVIALTCFFYHKSHSALILITCVLVRQYIFTWTQDNKINKKITLFLLSLATIFSIYLSIKMNQGILRLMAEILFAYLPYFIKSKVIKK